MIDFFSIIICLLYLTKSVKWFVVKEVFKCHFKNCYNFKLISYFKNRLEFKFLIHAQTILLDILKKK